MIVSELKNVQFVRYIHTSTSMMDYLAHQVRIHFVDTYILHSNSLDVEDGLALLQEGFLVGLRARDDVVTEPIGAHRQRDREEGGTPQGMEKIGHGRVVARDSNAGGGGYSGVYIVPSSFV